MMEAILKKRTIPLLNHQDIDSTKAVQLFFCGRWILLCRVAASLRRSLLHLRRNKWSKLAPKIEAVVGALDREVVGALDRGVIRDPPIV